MVAGADTSRALGGVEESRYLVDVGSTDEFFERGGKDVGDEVGEVLHRPGFGQPAVKLLLEVDLGLQFLGQGFG